MRKKVLAQDVHEASLTDQKWLDLERLAQVEVTSEDLAHPVEAALIPGSRTGWRASQPGEQRVRLLFAEPQRLRHIHLIFDEHERERSQELVLLWSPHGGSPLQEIVRQQFNFSPPSTTREVEDYTVALNGVGTLELRIVPHLGGGEAVASLAQLRLA
jgi:hypothetical protein